VAGEVVGVDASEPMLAQARVHCAYSPNVRFVRADFRTLELPDRFDAAVCPANSLNYVASVGELAEVFAGVAACLKPGGLFAFDTTTDRGMRWRSGFYLHARAGGRRFALHFEYDPARRAQRAKVIFPEGVETHARIALDPADVRLAARGTPLAVVACFAQPLLPWRLAPGGACYFVLKRER
ncbi:MAG: methyltransferase domain-containing protein, partial [Gemmataceae bacterium]|nr:methyltransferase domain-containing protein [Gemmataceae bacterium]